MDATTPEGFLQKQQHKTIDTAKSVIKDIEIGLEHLFNIIENKVIVPIPRHYGITQKTKDEVISRYLKAGWKDINFNESNASYTGYFEVYLFLPKT